MGGLDGSPQAPHSARQRPGTAVALLDGGRTSLLKTRRMLPPTGITRRDKNAQVLGGEELATET